MTGDLTLSWRWKVANTYPHGDARHKAGDDYPARVYVAFEFQPERAGFFERAKRKAVEVLFGETPPAIVGIAIMSDADNTGEQATAWYGDLVLTADQ